MRHVIRATVIVVALSAGSPAHADSSAYIERWASGTLTTGEPFESWRIHVVVPDGDDWVTSSFDGWLTGGPTWYLDWPPNQGPGGPPNPDLFPTYPDSEFAYYHTTPHLYPNSGLLGGITMTMDGILEPTYVHLGGWWDATFDTNGDYVVWQGTILNPIDDAYGNIEFAYATQQEPFVHPVTFTIPEPATAALLALGALGLLRRRLVR